MQWRWVLPVVWFLCGPGILQTGAQTLGLRSPSVKYFQINTDACRIIFPEGLETTAQRVAEITQKTGHVRPFTTGARLRKIDILLQNATDIPNGYVGLGPWRSEFYLTPPQSSFELGSLPWAEHLAIHEYRHVQQLSAAKTGLSGLAYYLMGEEAYSGFVHLAVPNWFIEGDAVVAETALSSQGRGRLPAFTNGYREMVRNGEYWPYAKARNGSYKTFIPSHYPLGFLLINYGREKYGQTFWDSIMTEAAGYSGLFYSFSHALKHRTGVNTKKFYEQAMDHYRELWYPHAPEDVSGGVYLSQKDNRYLDFNYPVMTSDGSLYVMVQRFDKIASICQVADGDLKHIVSPGFQTEPVFHAGGGKLCWTELRRHPRWVREDYSVIVVFDIETRKKRTLTERSSYFMPALSPDGRRIVAVFDNDRQDFALHILSAETGEILHILPNPENYFYTHPQWTADGNAVLSAVRMRDGRMMLVSQSVADGALRELTSPSFAPIGRPYIEGEWVCFTMTAEDADQLFRLHRATGFIEQLTFDHQSKYHPAILSGSGEILYAGFTLQGKELRTLDIETLSTRLLRHVQPLHSYTRVLPGEYDLLGETGQTVFPFARYPQLTRPIRLHSWSLFPDDPVYGIELLSENTLSTISWRSGWEYNQNTSDHGPFTELVFGLWYPELLAGYVGTRLRRTIQGRDFRWWQHNLNAGLRIPFQVYGGPYAQFGSITSRFNRSYTTGDFDGFRLNYLTHTLRFVNARKQALQHAESRFSQSCYLNLSHAVDTTHANQFHLETTFTVPSPFRNHLFGLEFDYRHELLANAILFSDVFDYARGYDPESIPRTDDIWRAGINYQFPLIYPDAGVIGLIYFKRLRLNGFYDLMHAGGDYYRSVGVELYCDVNLFNTEPVTFGLQWAKQLDVDQESRFALILPMGF